MNVQQVPIEKIGTTYQRPSWRYDAIQNPSLYGLTGFLNRKTGQHAGHLNRLITKGLSVSVLYKPTQFARRLCKVLTSNQVEQLKKVSDKQYYQSHRHKLESKESAKSKKLISWNVKKVRQLSDEWLRKLILHVFNYEHDDAIALALRLHFAVGNKELKRFIGFSIFAGVSDADIAKKWRIPSVRGIEAIRHLFFDFSHLPKDKVALWSMMRQFIHNGDITSEDFSFYKRIYDLGKLGLEAQVAFLHLTPEEQAQIKAYVSNSALIHTYNLDFSVHSSKDVITYNKMVSDLGKNSLTEELARQKNAETTVTKLTASKMSKELGDESQKIHSEDFALMNQIVRKYTEYDAEPKFVNFLDLQNPDSK